MKQNPAVKTGYFQNPDSIEIWMKQNPAVKKGYFQNPGSVEPRSRPGKIKAQSAIDIERRIFKEQSGMKLKNTLSNEQSGMKVWSCHVLNNSVCQKTLVAVMSKYLRLLLSDNLQKKSIELKVPLEIS